MWWISNAVSRDARWSGIACSLLFNYFFFIIYRGKKEAGNAKADIVKSWSECGHNFDISMATRMQIL